MKEKRIVAHLDTRLTVYGEQRNSSFGHSTSTKADAAQHSCHTADVMRLIRGLFRLYSACRDRRLMDTWRCSGENRISTTAFRQGWTGHGVWSNMAGMVYQTNH